MSGWLAMGGHGFYIWSSYGMLALAIGIELWSLRRRRRTAIRQAEELREAIEHERAPAHCRHEPSPQRPRQPRTRHARARSPSR